MFTWSPKWKFRAFSVVVGTNKDARAGNESVMEMINFLFVLCVNILYNLWNLNIVSLF